MDKKQLKTLKTFADVCKATGKKETDYNVQAGGTAAMKAFICLRRLKLICKPFNGKVKPNFADTTQDKWYPYVRIIPDTSSPFGFRLAFDDFVCVSVGGSSSLGARPVLLDSDWVEHVFETFREEFEQWMYWENMSYQEED